MYAADPNICYNLIITESSLSNTSQMSVLLNLFAPNHGFCRTALSLGGLPLPLLPLTVLDDYVPRKTAIYSLGERLKLDVQYVPHVSLLFQGKF